MSIFPERLPRRLLLPLAAALAVCAPAPQTVARKASMSSPTPPHTPSAAIAPHDSAAAALGRQTLSTAFVRVGPDGHLTVERHGGQVLVLRDVKMGPKKYCGVQASGARYCGSYAEVATARPGGAPAT